MRVIHDNFESLPVNARDLALAVRSNEQLHNLWSFATIAQGGMLSNIHYLHRRKKNRGGFGNPATTKIEHYVAKLLDLLLKKSKRI